MRNLIYIIALIGSFAYGQGGGGFYFSAPSGTAVDPIDVHNPILRWDNSTIQAVGGDGSNVTAWNDATPNNNDGTKLTNNLVLDTSGTEGDAVEYSTANQRIALAAGSESVGDYNIGTDEFTIIVRCGATGFVSGNIFGKYRSATSEANYFLQIEGDGDLRVNTGGNQQNNVSATHGAYSLYFFVVDATNRTVIVDGVQVHQAAVGTDNTSTASRTNATLGIGGSETNGQAQQGGTQDLFVLIDKALTQTEIDNIEAVYQIN